MEDIFPLAWSPWQRATCWEECVRAVVVERRSEHQVEHTLPAADLRKSQGGHTKYLQWFCIARRIWWILEYIKIQNAAIQSKVDKIVRCLPYFANQIWCGSFVRTLGFRSVASHRPHITKEPVVMKRFQKGRIEHCHRMCAANGAPSSPWRARTHLSVIGLILTNSKMAAL